MVRQAAKSGLRKVQYKIRDSGADVFDRLQVQTEKQRKGEFQANLVAASAVEDKKAVSSTALATKPKMANLKTRKGRKEAATQEARGAPSSKATPPPSPNGNKWSTATAINFTTLIPTSNEKVQVTSPRRNSLSYLINKIKADAEMAEPPSNTTSEVPISNNELDEEAPAVAKSAEDRKAAAALSSLDNKDDAESGTSKDVDQEAVKKAMERLAGGGGVTKKAADGKEKGEVKKVVKVEAGDVALVMEELELTKPNATELLKRYDGNVEEALTAYITPTAK